MIAAVKAPPVSLENDMKRIEGKRARNVARTNRYLNARLRTIGLDTDALDGQVRERRAQEEKESLAARAEYDRNEYVYRQVDMQQAEERQLRDQELERMRMIWFAQMRYKEEMERKEKEDIHSGVDFDNCGTSSVQKMAGEDRGNAARLEQQRAQMREWSLQQSEERRAREAGEAADMAAYWAYLERVNEMQGKLSEEEAAARKKLNERIKDENRQKALRQGEEMAAWKEQENEADAAELRYREHFLREEDGKDGPRAGFKGLTKSQKEEFYKSNAEMVLQRASKAEQEQVEETNWYFQQERMRLAMEQGDREERERVQQAEADMLRDLESQQLQLRQRNMRARQDRFGEIDFTHGMYAGFGKSCR